MMISNAAVGWILAIAGTFGVNYAQIQVNASAIENNQDKFDYIQEQLTDIQKFLRDEGHEHSEEDEDRSDSGT